MLEHATPLVILIGSQNFIGKRRIFWDAFPEIRNAIEDFCRNEKSTAFMGSI